VDFAALYRDYADTVYSYLAFKLKDQRLVEDLMQETFLAVHEKLQQQVEISSPRAWLLSIAHNKMVDFLRRSQTHQPLHAASLAADGEPAPSTLLVREALLQLEEPERSIVYGLYVEGLTYRELAAMLGLPEGTVKSKAHYARKRLYHWLQEGSPK